MEQAQLSLEDTRALERAEETIQRGLKTFVEVGEALMEIRDRRLYRMSHETFEAYCRERWNIRTSQAYRLIDSCMVVKNLSPIGDKPETESQARPLTRLKQPEQQREAWSKAKEKAEAEGKPVAARHVEEAAREVAPKVTKVVTREEYENAAAPSTRLPGEQEISISEPMESMDLAYAKKAWRKHIAQRWRSMTDSDKEKFITHIS